MKLKNSAIQKQLVIILNNMTKEELINFLKENLKVYIDNNGYSLSVSIYLSNELISTSITETEIRI